MKTRCRECGVEAPKTHTMPMGDGLELQYTVIHRTQDGRHTTHTVICMDCLDAMVALNTIAEDELKKRGAGSPPPS